MVQGAADDAAEPFEQPPVERGDVGGARDEEDEVDLIAALDHGAVAQVEVPDVEVVAADFGPGVDAGAEVGAGRQGQFARAGRQAGGAEQFEMLAAKVQREHGGASQAHGHAVHEGVHGGARVEELKGGDGQLLKHAVADVAFVVGIDEGEVGANVHDSDSSPGNAMTWTVLL